MVEHVWAQRTQEHGRSANGNYSFDGDTLYSYSTPIAKFWQGTRGRTFALITSETFSVTTSGKHMPSAYNIPNVSGTFNVPFICGGRSGIAARLAYDASDKTLHQGNADFLAAALRNRGKELARMHRTFWGIETADESIVEPRCNALRAMAKDGYFAYSEAFGIRKGVKALTRELDGMCESIRWAHEKYYSPMQIAKRAKHAAKRDEQREAAMFAYEAWNHDNGPLPTTSQIRLLPWQAKSTIERETSAELNEQARNDWLAGIGNAGGYGVFPYPMLRIKPTDSDIVETSMRAEFPLAHAVKAFRLIRRVAERGEAWESNGHSLHVGHFTISRIGEDGTTYAGCHRIPWVEIERFARKIGIFDQAE
jgi:hypothetical protein